MKFSCRDVVKVEGGRALFKGIGVTLVGVIPSRSIWLRILFYITVSLFGIVQILRRHPAAEDGGF